MRRGGRPGLLRTVTRTAVVAGTASATANAVNRRSQNKAAEREQAAAEQAAPAPEQAAAPAPAAPAGDLASQLGELGKLRDSGVLTQEEFDAAKAKLLA